MLKTNNCVFCGKKAVVWSGSVVGRQKRALGYVPIEVIAGKCEEHRNNSVPYNTKYEPNIAGACSPLFGKS